MDKQSLCRVPIALTKGPCLVTARIAILIQVAVARCYDREYLASLKAGFN
jgi:hypothetical protein